MINFLNFYARIIMNFNYSYYSFIDRSIFIIYKNIYSQFIKNIKRN